MEGAHLWSPRCTWSDGDVEYGTCTFGEPCCTRGTALISSTFLLVLAACDTATDPTADGACISPGIPVPYGMLSVERPCPSLAPFAGELWREA